MSSLKLLLQNCSNTVKVISLPWIVCDIYNCKALCVDHFKLVNYILMVRPDPRWRNSIQALILVKLFVYRCAHKEV